MFLDSDEEREEGTESDKMRPLAVDINLDLSALANARRYFIYVVILLNALTHIMTKINFYQF